MTQRFAGFRLVFAVVALALWAGDAANAQVERTPTAEKVVRNVKSTPTPNANPVVAPRRVSEEPAAGSRSANDGARVGPSNNTADDNIVSSRNVEGSTDCCADSTALVCCLKVCETEFYDCIQGIYHTCAASRGTKTPFECHINFKCCTLDTCIPAIDCTLGDCPCTPPASGACAGIGGENLCCPDGDSYCCPDGDCAASEQDCPCTPPASGACAGIGGENLCCPDGDSYCCPDGDCAASAQDCPCTPPASGACAGGGDENLCCPDGDSYCCPDGDCAASEQECLCPNGCGYNKKCCGGSCIYKWKCCVDEECTDNDYCCPNNNKCTNRKECCDGADTCYAKAPDLGCCWVEDTDDPKFPFYQGPCGGTTKSFNNWGWTNGPYDLTVTNFPSQSLVVYCGAGKCDTGKGFERDTFDFTWDGIKFTASWTATMPDPTAGWELHLGCGITGVYAKNKRNRFTVAPGQYEFRGTGTETLELTDTDFNFSSCNELYVIAHFCSTNPGAD